MSTLRIAATLLVLLVPATVWAGELVIEVADEADVGFNDPSPVSPVTGNPGTTVGEQRLNVLEAAGRDWLNRLVSMPDIRVDAAWESLECEESEGVLAFASPTLVFRDPALLAAPNVWYSWAQTNAFLGFEAAPGREEAHIETRINIDVGSADCLTGAQWDYRIGVPNTGATFSLFQVMLHELAHGFGFLTYVDPETGAKLQGFDDTFMVHVEDHERGRTWSKLNNKQRLASITKDGQLHWVGPNTGTDGATLISGLGDMSAHPLLYAPEEFSGGSSVNHFDPSLNAQLDETMEAFLVRRGDPFLSARLLQDLGWAVTHLSVVGVENLDQLGPDDIAVMRIGHNPARHNVRVFDPQTNNRVAEMAVDANATALDIATLSTFGDTSAREIAILTWSARGRRVQVFVRDSTSGLHLKTLNFPTSFPCAMLVVPDFGGSSTDEIAVLTILPSGKIKVFIKDAQSAAVLANLTFPEGLVADFAIVPSFGGGTAPEVVVVVIDPATGIASMHVRDAVSGAKLLDSSLDDDFRPSHARAVASFGGTGADEVALLGSRAKNGNPQVRVFDPASGAELMMRNFPDRFHPRAFERVPDFSGTPADELAILGRRRANVRARLFVIDSSSGSTLTTTTIPHKEQPHDLAVVPHTAGSGAPDLMIVTTAAADGEVRVYVKDARGQTIRNLVVGEGL
ncbi:MAG: hypothetical protein VYE73_10545 [Acidobacteriota bacterium]|nr:hypothetical protein [Acidobacteriota bacterium]